ncbi:CUB and zona pellucida-like domain-containing protein 1 [Portunus trituberculatus]|uniref:CUB and zona pellucida-like domain-containing protein 1 n=1 Tax=Portunus trituberculatus TaxID=210409 RepID=A0A5B7H5A2_PORTR|nr:CUB and zona pellucida-like domain-containing protein 1 [Portunus trituberculatus]
MIHEILVALFVLLPPILLPAAALNECGGVVDTQQHHTGVITSPGYPDHYPEDATCTWILQVRKPLRPQGR